MGIPQTKNRYKKYNLFGGYDLKCLTSNLTNLLNSIDECISRTRLNHTHENHGMREEPEEVDTNTGTVYVFTGNSSMHIGQQSIHHHGDINVNVSMEAIDDGVDNHCNTNGECCSMDDQAQQSLDARMRFFQANSP